MVYDPRPESFRCTTDEVKALKEKLRRKGKDVALLHVLLDTPKATSAPVTPSLPPLPSDIQTAVSNELKLKPQPPTFSARITDTCNKSLFFCTLVGMTPFEEET